MYICDSLYYIPTWLLLFSKFVIPEKKNRIIFRFKYHYMQRIIIKIRKNYFRNSNSFIRIFNHEMGKMLNPKGKKGISEMIVLMVIPRA